MHFHLGTNDWDTVSETDTPLSLEYIKTVIMFFSHFYKNVLILLRLISTDNKIFIDKNEW